MSRPKNSQPLINIVALYAKAKADVATYYEIINQCNFLIDAHHGVSKAFIIDTVLKSFDLDEQWFSEMQEHHKQNIRDSVRGKSKGSNNE